VKRAMVHTRGFYKYGVPLWLLLTYISFHINHFQIYTIVYDLWAEFMLLFFCYRELFCAYANNKCKWQKASIMGLSMFALVNILFYKNYESSYYDGVQFLVLGISLLVVLLYIVNEKYESF
jgi:hypothetical protein